MISGCGTRSTHVGDRECGDRVQQQRRTSACLTIPYDEAFYWDGTTYFGSSLQALCALAELRGYALVACDRRGVNAFFVRTDLVTALGEPTPPERLFRPPYYERHLRGHPVSTQSLVPYEVR